MCLHSTLKKGEASDLLAAATTLDANAGDAMKTKPAAKKKRTGEKENQ